MEKSIKIKSTLNKFCEIEGFINSIFSDFNFSKNLYCKIYLAVSEAVNNAIQHGNKFNSDKFVKVIFSLKGKQYIFLIIDEGVGFDYKNLNDPRQLDNIRKESGRGIFIMKQYADEVNFKKNGSSVQLIFHKTSD